MNRFIVGGLAATAAIGIGAFALIGDESEAQTRVDSYKASDVKVISVDIRTQDDGGLNVTPCAEVSPEDGGRGIHTCEGPLDVTRAAVKTNLAQCVAIGRQAWLREQKFAMDGGL